MLIPLILFVACTNIYASDSDSGSDSNYSEYEYAPVRHARSHNKANSPILTRQKTNLKNLSNEEKKAKRREQNRKAAVASRARKKQALLDAVKERAKVETAKEIAEADCARLKIQLKKQAKAHAQKTESTLIHISLLTNDNIKFQQKMQEMEQAKKQAEENAHTLELQLQQALVNLQQTTQLATQVLAHAAEQHSLGYAQIETTAYQVDYFV